MKIRLGYVALPLTLNKTASKTITYTNYKKLEKQKQIEKLDKIINQNFEAIKQILKYNHKNNIFFYNNDIYFFCD